MLFWGVCLLLGNIIESTINALFLQSPPSHSNVLWSTSSAEIQTWLTLCAAPGPNQTRSTWQPLKCPVRSSSAMTLLLTHHTHTRASADTDGEAGPGNFPGLWYLYLRFAQSSKNHTKPQHHPEDAQREAQRTLQRVWPVPFRASWTEQESMAFGTVVIFHSLGSHHHPGQAPPEPGHHPMRQCDGSYNYRALQLKLESVRLPALVRRSSPRCCTGHR